MWVLYRIAHLPYWLFNVHLWAGKRGARIGPGLFLIHPNNVYFPPRVELGEDCTIFHEVTMGTGHAPGFPTLGNRVTVYAGARVLGGIHIGDDVMIGANCVVSRDVPADTIVMPPSPKNLPRALSPKARMEDSRADSRQPDAPALASRD
jgi:serine O-acetyltransferase